MDFSPTQVHAYILKITDGNDRPAVVNVASSVVTKWDRPPIDAINAIGSQAQVEAAGIPVTERVGDRRVHDGVLG
ncbi:hypothetical protein [Microvirga sp. TS319]|uniref:hypothetical protein n=1 Tax=Microvirga sp. TS319 TaxID=3241165 RepID=UPI00351A480D